MATNSDTAILLKTAGVIRQLLDNGCKQSLPPPCQRATNYVRSANVVNVTRCHFLNVQLRQMYLLAEFVLTSANDVGN